MKLHPTLTLAFMGGTTALFTLVQPAWAASTQVTAVELTPTEAGLSLVLNTAGDADQPAQVFAVPKGKKWVADVPNTQLRLPKGNEFRQSNPVPGIAAVTVSQVGSGVRITVEGSLARPLGEVVNRDRDRIVLSLNPGEGHLAADNGMHDPAQGTKDLPPDLKLATPALELAQLRPPPASGQEVAPGPVVPPPSPSPSTPPKYDVMIPNPKVEITGGPPPVPSSSVPPPFLPRAIAPPLGDMSVSNIDATPTTIDLGTNEVVPRLVLREAPVRDVLALLARAAGLNLAFSDSPSGASPGGGPGGMNTEAAAAAAQRTITLDIENEPVQDVFNYVIQLSGFQANRVGRTIFVGERLPLATRDIAARTMRLNQATAAVAAGLLSAQGAETQRLVTRTTRTEEGTGIDRRVREETEQTIEPLAADPSQSRGPLLLSGLSVVADDRLNQVTVIGDSRQVQIASAILKQQDLRKRQASVNVKVIDVTLRSTESFSSQFSAGIGDAFFVVDNGQAVARFGKMAPANANDMTNSRFGRPIVNNPLAGVTPFDNPNGTELIRDPVTGEFVRARPNQPGSIFGPGGDPLTPGANIVDPARLPANATTGSPQLFFDRNGIPRSYSELTVGGGRFEPLRNNTNNLITAGSGPARFYDETGTARLFNELTVGGGKFKPLLGSDSSPVAVAEEQMWLDTSGTPRRFDELTLGGGNFRPYINEDGEILSLAGDAVAAFLDKNGTPRRFSELTLGGGTFEPFRNPAGNLVQAALSAPQFFDVNGIPRLFSDLTVGGGTFAPLFDPNGAPISARAAIQALPSFIGEAAQVAYRLPQVFQYPQQFLAQLNANVETGNAKILTDPTLTVQEGETATIQLGDQVVTNVIEEVVPAPAGGQPVRTINNVLTPVGLDLNLAIERIDDNGFISLRVTPNVATPSGTQFVQTSQGPFQVFRVSTREVSSGLIRLRDGQTMLLAGIITEQDSETVSKVPVLGDLPIVGALFRSRQGQKDRSEIVIAITPNILDDSDRANFGYNYTPSREVQQVLQRSQQVR